MGWQCFKAKKTIKREAAESISIFIYNHSWSSNTLPLITTNSTEKQLSSHLKQDKLMTTGSSNRDELRDGRTDGQSTHMGLCQWTVAQGSAGRVEGWGCQPACSWPSWCWPWRTQAAGSGGSQDQTGPPEIKQKAVSAKIWFKGSF